VRTVRRLIDFYRVQVELIWTWRRGRRQLLLRAAVSFVVAFVSLGATAAVLPGLTVSSPAALAVAVLVIAALSALLRPLLLALVAPFSLFLMLAISLAYQIVVILALVPLVPGVRIGGISDAALAAAVFAIVNSLITWLISFDSDDSYYSMLVRRLLVRREDVVRTTEPGMVIVQFDGLSHAVLSQQVNAGRVPVISRWLNDDCAKLANWVALLPSQTSASQAGIMFGNNDDIPAFRWWDKEQGRLFVSNRPEDAEALEERLRGDGHPGLLHDDGASIGNLCSGGAARSYLTMATVRDPGHGLGRSQSYFSFFLSPYGFVHAIVLGIAEAVKELFQAYRARAAGIEPRLARGFPYPFLRAITNVVLRPLCTSLVIEEMLRGTRVIYVTYTDYDEIAHHSGPQRAESLDALDGLDRTLGSLARAAEDAPRPYRFVVLSDHGQTLGATFRQRFGRPLADVVRQLMGGSESVAAAVGADEQWRAVDTLVSELTRARGAGTVARSAQRQRQRQRDREQLRSDERDAHALPAGTSEVVVCASGNLALIYFPQIAGRADLDTLERLYPDMVRALATHPGVGLLMVRGDDGALVMGHDGRAHLATRRVDGNDPLEAYGGYAARALERLDQMSNCGDLVLISMLDEDTDQVAAFEELIGSHGGLGGPQNDALILYPAELSLETEPMVGAVAVHGQLRKWLAGAEA
jgi:uncharacterized membrane protein YvlD (DUF360 family)